MLEESLYNGLVAGIFKKLLQALDAADPDLVEADSTGEMVTITSRSGEKVVVNTQRAVRQLWVAGQSQGIHFDYDPALDRWVDDRGKGLELNAWVKACVEAISGVSLGV